MLRLAIRGASVAILFAASPVATVHAQVSPVNGQLDVKLLVNASCEVSGSQSGGIGTAVLDFGTAQLLLNAVDADTGTSGVQALQVLCSPGVQYTVHFGPGQNASDIANRAMKRAGGSELVQYQLYSTAARTTVLDTLTGTGTGVKQVIQVFGRIPAQTAPPAGNYTDSITVAVTF